MTAPQFRSVDQHSGAVAGQDALTDARAEVAHYADLNHMLGQALARATDTAKNAVAQEQALQEELDEVRRDAQELWERAMRADELERANDVIAELRRRDESATRVIEGLKRESRALIAEVNEVKRKLHAAEAELNSTRGIVAAARGIR